MSTGTTLITHIRDELQDTTDASFGNEELLRYINRGATEFCATTGCLQATTYISTAGIASKFSLTDSCSNLFLVFGVDYAYTPLKRTYRHEITYEFGTEVGTPTCWYEFVGIESKKTLYLDKMPPENYGIAGLAICYLRTPTDLSAVSSTFNFPNEWEPAIIYYAMARCYASQRDTILATQNMAKYETMRQTAHAINKFKLMGDAR